MTSSQNVTAPKLSSMAVGTLTGLTSSQNVTAPKLVDTEQYYDKTKKIMQTRGLADLEHGIELKTLIDTASFNTVDKHIGNAGKKANTKTLVIDSTHNDALDDRTLADMIKKSRRFKNGKIYILNADEFRRIR